MFNKLSDRLTLQWILVKLSEQRVACNYFIALFVNGNERLNLAELQKMSPL